jgi:hypothetical protein
MTVRRSQGSAIITELGDGTGYRVAGTDFSTQVHDDAACRDEDYHVRRSGILMLRALRNPDGTVTMFI